MAGVNGNEVVPRAVSVTILNSGLGFGVYTKASLFGEQSCTQGTDDLRVFTEEWFRANFFAEFSHHAFVFGNPPGDTELLFDRDALEQIKATGGYCLIQSSQDITLAHAFS